jgi:Putative beta-barrel porin 2
VRGKWKFAVAAAIAAVGLTAQAQEGLRDRDPVLQAAKKIAGDLQAASFHNGDFYLLSHFELSDLGYGAQYFSPTGTTSSGFSIAASAPQRFYFVPTRRVVLSIDVVPQIAWIYENGTHTQSGYRFRGDAQFIFNHLYLDFYGLTTDELRPHTGELNRVLTIREHETGVSGEFKYTSRTSALFSARYRRANYPTNRLQPTAFELAIPQLDRDENNYRVSALHKTLPLTSITLAAEHSDYTFKNSPIRDSTRDYAAAGFILDNGKTVLHAEAGPGRLNFKQVGERDFKGVLGNAGVSHRAGDRWRVGANATRDLDFSIYPGNNYYISERYDITIDYAVTRRLTLNAISDLSHDRYDSRSPLLPILFPLRRDRTTWNAVGWNYGLRRMSGGFDIGYYKRTSTTPDVDQTHGIRFVIHLSFTP